MKPGPQPVPIAQRSRFSHQDQKRRLKRIVSPRQQNLWLNSGSAQAPKL
jgi:hypothetical protein